MWRPVVMTLAGLAGYGILVLLAWLEHEAEDGSARQSERERQRGGFHEATASAGRPGTRRAGGPGA